MMGKQQPNKRYLLFCEPCSFKKIIETNNPDDLVSIKRSSVPSGSPKLDPATKKTKVSKAKENTKMCKCPRCGRGAIIKNLPEVYKKTYKEIDDSKRKEQEAIERKKRLEDGKPHQRNVDEDFIG